MKQHSKPGSTHASTPPPRPHNPNGGFSLVELSIVLVILGLLTGGILAGQSLIRAAELRSVASEYARYVSSTQSFRDKYMSLPGDSRSATRFWGSAGGSGTIGDGCESASGTGTQTCNGNGDARLDNAGAGARYGEGFTFWQHMANAGLIEGIYSGKAGAASQHDSTGGVNVPKSRVFTAMWRAYYSGDRTNAGDNKFFNANYQNTLRFLGPSEAAVLKAEEAWGIDKKLDDGRPAQGFVFANDRVGCAVAADGSALTSAAADAAKLDAQYNLTSSTISCALMIRMAF